jgi:hypothetical protein
MIISSCWDKDLRQRYRSHSLNWIHRFEVQTITQTSLCEEVTTNSPASTTSTAANHPPSHGDNSKTPPCKTMDSGSPSTTASRDKAAPVGKVKRKVLQSGSSHRTILTKNGKLNPVETL